ncbi:MAG: helix-turn-helix transcriptional regulator [Candidatus Sulfotelmatobacter sp.]
MTRAQQLGSQIKTARSVAGLSLRRLGALAGIPATTLEGYEAGASVPAEKLARIADVLRHHTFKVDGYEFTVNRVDRGATLPTAEQMTLNFIGEYDYAKARVRIGPGKITILLDGKKTSARI